MPTDDERREVARRLRDRLKTDGIGGLTSGEFGNAVYFSVMHGHRGGYGEAGAFLANLIEPSPPCEFWDSEEQECYSVRTVRPVDRDALLELADEMEEFGSLPVKRPGVRVLHDENFSRELGYARRIRKALGVEP